MSYALFCVLKMGCLLCAVWSSRAMLRTGKFLEGSTTITNGFTHAISTGNWVLKRFKVDRQGVTQVQNTYSRGLLFIFLGASRDLGDHSKNSKPFVLLSSTWRLALLPLLFPGFICFLEKKTDIFIVQFRVFSQLLWGSWRQKPCSPSHRR